MLKPKDLASLSDKELKKTYLYVAQMLTSDLETLKCATDFESEQKRFEEAKQTWADVRRCHNEVASRKRFCDGFVYAYHTKDDEEC